jgi:predicted MFS family arabinose efflux permease
LGVREFRWLWVAGLQSVVGDQVARVALSVLVFDRTTSAALTAVVYALTFLPAVVGGVVLGPVADRVPRRRVLVVGDLARAGLLVVMAVVVWPWGVLAAFVVVVVVLGAPWSAAEAALIADILPGEWYPVGLGLRTASVQVAQLAGFAVGGVVVAVVGARTALGVDGATFAASAVLIRVGVRYRPAARGGSGAEPTVDPYRGDGVATSPPPPHSARHTPAPAPAVDGGRGWWGGVRVVLGERRLRLLLAFSWLLGLLVVPEGLAVPYAAQLGAGASAVGVLLSAGPAGVAVGTVLFTRVAPPARRGLLLGPLAMSAGLPLVVCAVHPGVLVSAVLWAISGACTAYQVQVVTEFMQVIPAAVRGQGIGVATAGVLAAQGIGLLAGGVLATATSPAIAVAAAGGCVVVLGALMTIARSRMRNPSTSPGQG